MAKIVVKCESCGAEREVDEKLAGSVLSCANCEAMVRVPLPDIAPGLEISGFVLEKQLGFGSMGEVWLARQTAMDRLVALKLLSREFTLDSNFVDRFMKEVKISAKMDHPNVITAFDAGCHGDIHYLAMSYVEGRTLEDVLLENGVSPERDALEIVRDVAEALRYAWDEFEIIHRDIKPSNIMLDRKGVAKLMDMGISKSVKEEASLTMTGTIIGTPYYMSPEQGMGEKNLDFRSDIYSLGATLYHLVTGSVPFDATSALGIVSKHITEPLPSPLERNPNLSAGCAALLETMMAKKREDRQDSWKAVVEDMRNVLNGGMPTSKSVAGEGSAGFAPSSRTGKGKVLVVVGSLAALAFGLAVVAGVFLMGGNSSGDAASACGSNPVAGGGAGGGESVRSPSDGKKPSSPSLDGAGKTPSKPSAETASPSSASADDAERKRAEMWKFAADFAASNKGRYDLVISNFEKIKKSLAGTKYELMANVEIEKLKKKKQAAVAKVLERLRREGAKLAGDGDFASAAALVSGYSGDFAKETRAERTKLADGWHSTAALAVAKAKRVEEEKRLRDALYLQGVVFKIMGRDYKGALASLDSPECPNSPAVGEIREVVEEFSGGAGKIIESFSKDVGKSVTIETDKGAKDFKISRVKNGKVYYSEKRHGAVIQKPLDLKTLSLAERAKRGGLGGLATQVSRVFAAAAKKDASAASSSVEKLPATPGGAVFKDAFLSIAAKKKMLEALKTLGFPKPTFDVAVVREKLKGIRMGAAKRRAMAVALLLFERRFGDTSFAKSHADLLKVLKESAKGGDKGGGVSASAVSTTPKSAPVDFSGSPPSAEGMDSPKKIKAALKEINPAYDGAGMFRIRSGRCVGAILSDASGVDDRVLAFLAKLPLIGLDVSGTAVKDLSPLAATPTLKMLNVSRTGVDSLSPLKGIGLNKLDISRTKVSDLSPLEGMPLDNLKMFECPVEDYSVLATLSKLRILEPATLWKEIPGKEGTRNSKPRKPRPGVRRKPSTEW